MRKPSVLVLASGVVAIAADLGLVRASQNARAAARLPRKVLEKDVGVVATALPEKEKENELKQ
jgi:hypothetical protein